MTTNNLEPFDSRLYDDLCYHERQRIVRLPYNQQYGQSFVYRGKTYMYDPDYDCFYPRVTWESLSHWDRYGWLYVTAILAIVCFFVSN